jgi:hypothetical protein
MKLFASLQDNFQCCARHFNGRTSFFNIAVGCKQGDCLSPLKYNLFLDLAVKYIVSKGLGYKYTFKHIPSNFSMEDIQLSVR